MANASDPKVIERVTKFVRVNNPDEFKARASLVNHMVEKRVVVMPSILGPLANSSENKALKVDIFFGGKQYKTTVRNVEFGRLAVTYSNHVFAEIVESGMADKLYVTLNGSTCRFIQSDNVYIPTAEKNGDFTYPTVLYPFYKKDVIDVEIWKQMMAQR